MRTDEAPVVRHHSPTGKSWYELGCYSSITLDRRIETAAARYPEDRITFVSDERPASTTIAAIIRDAEQVSSALWALGVRGGDRIAIQVPNWREGYLLNLASLRIGAAFVPIVTTYGDSEIRFILEDAGARVFFCPTNFRRRGYVDAALALQRDGLVDELIFIADESVPSGTMNWQTFMGLKPREALVRAADADAVCAIFYTSGSTARPKGVRHTHNTLGFEIREGFFGVAASGPGLFVVPMTHMGGWMLAFDVFMVGGGDFVMDAWDPDEAARLIAQHRLRRFAATPFHHSQLMDSADRLHLDISPLTSCSSGSTVVPTALVKRALEHGLTLCRCYGSSEHPTISQIYENDPPEFRATTDGRIVPCSSVRIVDEHNHDLPRGAPGEILSSGPELFVGYTDKALNDEAFSDNCWFRTGDVGVLNEQNYLAITGREKDIIIRGGEKISSREVEETLATHPSVAESAAVAAPDPYYTEKVCAFVLLKSGMEVSLQEVIRHFAASGLAKLKTPERLVVLDEFPRTVLGKVAKKELRKYLDGEPSVLGVLLDQVAPQQQPAASAGAKLSAR
jgi:acyl-CoA synthetase (AMP-forming)/AMP-acid ligase II